MPDCVPGPRRHDAGQIHVLGDPRLVDLLEAARAHGGDKGGPIVERRGLLCGPGVGAADGGARVERGEKEAPGLDHARDLATEKGSDPEPILSSGRLLTVLGTLLS